MAWPKGDYLLTRLEPVWWARLAGRMTPEDALKPPAITARGQAMAGRVALQFRKLRRNTRHEKTAITHKTITAGGAADWVGWPAEIPSDQEGRDSVTLTRINAQLDQGILPVVPIGLPSEILY